MELRHKILATLPLLLMLGACSEEPKTAPKAVEKKPPEAVTAMSALYKMYPQARSWAADCEVLRIGSLRVNEVKGEAGKAGAWEAVFVSASNQRQRRYTFSVVESPSSNLHEGVFGGGIDSWRPGKQARPMIIQAIRTDTPAAYETAMKNKGADYAAKNPNMPVLFILEQTPRFPNPAWRVVWGESVATSGFSVFVDASTGEFLQTGR